VFLLRHPFSPLSVQCSGSDKGTPCLRSIITRSCGRKESLQPTSTRGRITLGELWSQCLVLIPPSLTVLWWFVLLCFQKEPVSPSKAPGRGGGLLKPQLWVWPASGSCRTVLSLLVASSGTGPVSPSFPLPHFLSLCPL
jgi:hypothetical protein